MTNHDKEISQWYIDKSKEADRIREELVTAKEMGLDAKEIRKLERKLEQALYVGD